MTDERKYSLKKLFEVSKKDENIITVATTVDTGKFILDKIPVASYT